MHFVKQLFKSYKLKGMYQNIYLKYLFFERKSQYMVYYQMLFVDSQNKALNQSERDD